MPDGDSTATIPTNYQGVTIRTVDGLTVYGRVNIHPFQRISDLLMQKDSFIAVVEGALKGTSGKTLFINKNHIIWIEPEQAC